VLGERLLGRDEGRNQYRAMYSLPRFMQLGPAVHVVHNSRGVFRNQVGGV